MRNGIIAIGRIQKQHARLAVVMRLLDDLIEQVTRADFFISINFYSCGFGLFQRAVEIVFLHFRAGRGSVIPNPRHFSLRA